MVLPLLYLMKCYPEKSRYCNCIKVAVRLCVRNLYLPIVVDILLVKVTMWLGAIHEHVTVLVAHLWSIFAKR